MTGRVPDPSELAEDLAEIKAAILRGNRETADKLDALSREIASTYLRQDVYEVKHDILLSKVALIEGRMTWLGRTAVTALILPIVVTIVAAIIVSGLTQ